MATLNDVDLQTLLAGIGGPAYNPQRVGPDWARLVQYIYAGQRAGKENKRQRAMETEDRALEKKVKEAQAEYYGQSRYAPREDPDLKHQRELEKIMLEHRLRLKEIGAASRNAGEKEKVKSVEAEAKEDYKEKKRIIDQNRKERETKLKDVKVTIPNRLKTLDNQITTLQAKIQKAVQGGDVVTPMFYKSQLDNLNAEKQALEGRRDQILAEAGIETEEPTEVKSPLTQNLPQTKSILGIFGKKAIKEPGSVSKQPSVNAAPAGRPPKAPTDKTKLVDGVIYEFPNGAIGRYDKKTNSVIPVE